LPGTKNESSVMKCHIALTELYGTIEAGRRLWDMSERACHGKFLFVKYCIHIIGGVKTAMEFRMR